MWYLIFISIVHSTEPTVQNLGAYTSMTDCFSARENLSAQLGSNNGYYPTGTNALCILRSE